MAYQRDDVRTRVRDLLYEDTADLFTDARINRAIEDALRELPRIGIYNEEIQTTTQVLDQIDYDLDNNVIKVEKVEINIGSASKPVWDEVSGWDQYKGALYLRSRPTSAYTMRIHCKQDFTVVSDDSTDYDFADRIVELVVVGAAIRCYRMIMGYFLDASNWDALAKPDGIDMSKVANWIQALQTDYRQLVQAHKTTPRPRTINLVD